MRTRDLALIVVAFAGIAGGVFLPAWAGWFSPVTVYLMMAILYLSFLRIDFSALARLRGGDLAELAWWSLVKLAILPVGLWGLCAWLAPGWALPVLLLSGVSAGVTAPFFSQLLGGNAARTLQLTVVTSMLVPFTLPALVGLLAGAELNIPFGHLSRMLAKVIFIPLALAWLTRRLPSALAESLERVQFPLILALFFCINLGVFAPYAQFFFEQAHQVAAAVGLAYGLAAAYFAAAWLMGPLSGGRLDSISHGTGLVFINNVLVVVFAAKFFGARSTLLAAVYLLPLYMMVLPFRLIRPAQGGKT
jgi:BASS family bile acid:Na+ symporter